MSKTIRINFVRILEKKDLQQPSKITEWKKRSPGQAARLVGASLSCTPEGCEFNSQSGLSDENVFELDKGGYDTTL